MERNRDGEQIDISILHARSKGFATSSKNALSLCLYLWISQWWSDIILGHELEAFFSGRGAVGEFERA